MFKYDDKGNVIDSCEYNSADILYLKFTYKYDYDGIGNWLKKTEFKNYIPKSITEREIEYY